MEIRNKKNYKQFVLLISLILLAGLGIFWAYKKDNIVLSIIFFFIFELILLSKKFTYRILITTEQVQIIFYKWGVKRILDFDIRYVNVKSDYVIGNRGYKYKSLNVYFKNKLVYNISTNDGFGEDDISSIEEILSSSV